jgi:hypothetical protein
LSEEERVITRFSQTFVIRGGATTLSFTIVSSHLLADEDGPPDAFEVALLDASTMLSAVGTAAGLNNTDALLNLQADGRQFFGTQVTVPDVAASGQSIEADGPLTVSIDISGIAAGTAVTLYFDLLGFGGTNSSVVVDDVILAAASIRGSWDANRARLRRAIDRPGRRQLSLRSQWQI